LNQKPRFPILRHEMVYYPAPTLPIFNDLGMYKTINLQVAPSEQANGLDLPLHDIDTLRFFFNLGVRQSRLIRVAQPVLQPAAVPSTMELQLQHLRLQMAQQQLQMRTATAAAPIANLTREALISSLTSTLRPSTTVNPVTPSTLASPTPIVPSPASAFSSTSSTCSIPSVSSSSS
ncbi:hypothetical protein PMAYCL1PPCAC_17030, partial [Pristionchus mayeri]